jgi:integrase
MSGFIYTSPLKTYIQAFILQKRALGYKYETSAKILSGFDRFCLAFGLTQPDLSKSLVLAWCQKRPQESQATLCGRAGVIRQLGLYLLQQGVPAYVLPKKSIPKPPRYVPHIFSDAELAAIFKQADRCQVQSIFPLRHLIMPVLFRLLYGCGLRISEALNLKLQDVDLASGVLTLRHAKFDKDRLIPLATPLLDRFQSYSKQVHAFSCYEDYFFPGPPGRALTQGNVYKNFRKFLWQSRLPHGGWGKGPRLHDLRHTFAVHCLRGWVREGRDLAAFLPLLKTYLGHDSFRDTAAYLRLTGELYPDLTNRVEQTFGQLIPVERGPCDETD